MRPQALPGQLLQWRVGVSVTNPNLKYRKANTSPLGPALTKADMKAMIEAMDRVAMEARKAAENLHGFKQRIVLGVDPPETHRTRRYGPW